MNDFNFNKWNRILGWLTFFIAFCVYFLTVEPTASFWDAGEYIATSSKLQIGHPPGAPLFQMIGAFASIFAADSNQIALMVNLTSAAASAFAILFMFWSISILITKLIIKDEELTTAKSFAVLGSAFVGALAFTFTDSFWFNAVEAEVYAMAICILSVLFYLGLRWEQDMHQPRGNRWLILISFVVGLSFGVHFMGLLSIPAIGLLYYFKNYEKITVKNFIVANIIVVIILLFIFKLLLPSTLKFFGASEVFFVNSIGLPFNSGTIIAFLLITAAFYFGIRYSRAKGYVQLNTFLLCILFILIGFSSWIMLPIRANAGTVINENNPNNARELLAYYNLEQYPQTHLFYGPQFTELYGGLDEETPYVDDKPNYEKDEKTGKYVIINDWKNSKQNISDDHKAFLPRMWSTEHVANYMEFTGPLEFKIKSQYSNEKELIRAVTEFRKEFAQGRMDYNDYHKFLRSFSDYLDITEPSFLDNIKYLIEYQMGYMYWRYFMWNFVGRQDDNQGRLTDLEGNWLSGIDFIDQIRLGNQDMITDDAKNNKARNTYYFLPLILGLFGLVFQLQRDKKNFWVMLIFFLFTGLALKIYLNERPFEPRERDYALVGSFYVFSLWIGFGVYALFDMIKNFITPKVAAGIVTITTLFAVPVVLATQNWDDHDRSNRYTAQAMAKMYLQSCQEDAILFTIGDNDTFALWYAQEIEGYRTDVRTINTSLFATDWYIDQMKCAAYESAPIPSQLTHEFYRYGTNDAIFYQRNPRLPDTLDIKKWMQWIQSDDPRTQGDLQNGAKVNTFTTKNIRIPVDKEAVLRNGIVSQKDAHLIVPYIDIKLKGDVLYKNRLLMLDIMANNNWERPIYFTGGSFGDDDYLWMKDYLQLDGLTYKLVPIRTPIDKRNPFDMGRVDSETMYKNVMSWDWGNSESPDIYHDPETRKNAITYRSNLARLVEVLINEKKLDKAEEILDLGMKQLPIEYYEYYTLIEPYISGYYKVNKIEKARELWMKLAEKYKQRLKFFNSLSLERQYNYMEDIVTDIERYRNVIDVLVINNDKELIKEKATEFNEHLRLFAHFYSSDEEIDPNKSAKKAIDTNSSAKKTPAADAVDL